MVWVNLDDNDENVQFSISEVSVPKRVGINNSSVIHQKEISTNWEDPYIALIGTELYYSNMEIKEHCFPTLESAYHEVVRKVFKIKV